VLEGALKLGAAAEVVPVDKLGLVLVAIFAFVFLGERPSIRERLGFSWLGPGWSPWDGKDETLRACLFS
jgi:uncharacterized membrane protein